MEVCQLSRTIPDHLRQAERTAAQLTSVSAGYIRSRYGRNVTPNGSWHWWRDDWRGKRGDTPRPDQIIETILLERVETADTTAATKPANDTMARLQARIEARA